MPKFINKDQLDKLAKSLNSKSKAVVSEEEQRAQAAEQALQTEIETTRDMFGGKSIVYITQAEYDSLSEKEQNDNTKAYFITDAEDLSHKHNNKDLLDNFGARNITIGNSSKTFDGSKNIFYTLSDIGAAESGHTHDDRYYTESEVNTKLSDLQTEVSADIKAEENRAKAAETSLQTAIDGKADTSHGNHVPKTQTANNAIFLRCDNTWATVTPDNIGAAAASHGTHVTYSTTVPKANGTATVGSEASVARGDHVHPAQTSVSGNAGTATALQNARTITIGNQSNSFDGTANISYSVADIGAAPASHNHDGRYYTEAEVDVKIGNLQSEIDSDVKVETDRAMEVEAELQAAIGGKANASHNHNDLYYTESEMNTKLAAKADKEHDHDDDYYTQTEIDGKIQTINTAINGKANASHGNHVPTTETANNARFLRNDNTWATITPGNIGAAKESHGTHVTWSTTVPKANGTASIGSETKVARGDHVHPLQESVEKLTTARTITIGNQGIDFDGSANIDFTLGDIGAAAAGHNHDERYYTEAEINTKVTNLQAEIDADVKVEADRAKKAEAALEAAIGGKAASGHTHDDRYFTETEVTNKLATKSDIGHDHDDDYYTETEIDGKIETLETAIDGKANASHGNHVPATQTADNKVFLRNDNTWATITPENIGAAKSSHGTHVTWATNAPKAPAATAAVGSVNRVAREDHVHPLQETITGNAGSADKLSAPRNITIGNKTNSFDGSENISYTLADIGAATSEHNHDSRYYTESEINTKVTNLQKEIDADVKAEADRAKEVEQSLQAAIDGKANASHGNHVPTTQTASNKVFLRNDNTWATITPANIGAAASSHTHDDRYFTETEINSKITTINTAISDAQTAAQNYADTKIAALVGSAPESLNTLQELSKAITDHEDVYEAYVVEMDSKLASKSDTGHTHNYAGSSSAGGAATSANKVNSNLVVKLNSGSTEGTNLFTFNGGAAKTINITPDNIGAAKYSHGIHVDYASAAPKENGTAAIGSSSKVAREDHVHPLQTTISGNAGSADTLSAPRTITIGNKGLEFNGSKNLTYTLSDIGAAASGHTHKYAGSSSAGGAANKVANSIKVQLNGGTTEGTNQFTFDGSAAKTINITASSIGAVGSNHGTHVTYSTTVPKVAGTASAGSESAVARGDHVHPAQTSVSGNAGTATKLETARTITVNGVVKGSASFDGSQNITITTSANDITAITKSLTVGTDWMDTGITGSHLSTGTYAVQMYANCQGTGGLWREYFSGIMSWVADGTNSTEADEISLHKAGHAPNGQHIYLRTKRNQSGSLVLQIAAKTAITTAISFEFKFKKLI